MPFTEHSRSPAIGLKDIGNRLFVFPKDRTACDRMPNPGGINVPTSHQGGASWRACGSDMKVRQTNTLFAKLINVWSLQIAGRKEIHVAVSNVIDHDQHDTFWLLDRIARLTS